MFLYTVKAVIISDVPLQPASLKKESRKFCNIVATWWPE